MSPADSGHGAPSGAGRIVPLLDGQARVEFERHLTSGPAEAWSLLTVPERLARWMAPVEFDGADYRIVFGDAEDDVVTGKILECEEYSRLVVTWEVPGAGPSRVEATLEPRDAVTVLHLVHSGLAAPHARGLAAGWQAYLDQLEAHVDGRELAEDWQQRWTRAVPEYQRQLPPGLAAVQVGGSRGSLRFERRLEADLPDAWSVVTEPERIARWFAPVTVDGTGVGARWRTFWDDGAEYAEGVVQRCEPLRLLEVTWAATDDADSAESLLRVTLSSSEDGVLLVLEHAGLGSADLVQYGAGWQSFLEQIESRSGRDWSDAYLELKPIYEQMVGR
ncbi:SRPBCC family protein [Bogoriella caseilytica]|uniref:Uncharacterized protein YndB with AHSA1/START domain n=1 Tax=Bogoriella caseilytica TaxID=56055 RepID=A0A3N2B981_9MICO|nr:SRPBCC family protein [Bogoriella caseilytica]ROR71826.1 uncharacterized protein YndB with AHSA1/START domain [Bogoriella caseilytica]